MVRELIALCYLITISAQLLHADEDVVITHGPILGRLGAHYVGIWVRTSQPGAFGVRYGLQPDNLAQLSPPVVTTLDHDNTGYTIIDNLKSNTRYFYQAVITSADKTESGLNGSFQTLPDPDDFRDPETNPAGLFNFSFEFGCGNNQNDIRSGISFQPVYDMMLANITQEINFAILNGDWLYEEKRGFRPEEWMEQVNISSGEIPTVVKSAPNIVGAWENYKLYLDRGKSMAEWHRQVPSFFVFDDHELLDDIRGAGQTGWREHRAVYRDIGVRAWYDYLGWSNPIAFRQPVIFGQAQFKADSDVLFDPEADFMKLSLEEADNLHVHWGGPTAWRLEKRYDFVDGDPNAGVYDIVKILGENKLQIKPAAKETANAPYSIGRRNYFQMRVANCDFFVIDTRCHRQIPVQAEGSQPEPSILGNRQKEWLKKSMKASDADFLFVVSSVNLVVPHILDVGEEPGPEQWVGQHDSWTGFPNERKEMIKLWDSLAQPVFVLTGDLHNSFVCKISDNLWEFASGPHSSSNASMGSEGERPANGPFEYQGIKCDIRWSTYRRMDARGYKQPIYCIVQINNVFRNPTQLHSERWVAFPIPQVIFKYYDGLSGRSMYAESVLAKTANAID
jgi:phosphodiesterase/alkaline phosphatase D-like protein